MTTFTAVTYNVLAQSFVRRDRYPQCPPEALDPARRHALLLTRVAALDADLLCLQEVEPAVFDDLRALLDATHEGAFAKHGRRPDGVAVFARRSRFGWLGHEARSAGSGPAALVAELTLDARPLRVACAHLTWKPDSTPPAEHPGHQQLLDLLAHRDAVAPDATWIFAGDFNATAQSAIVSAALDRGLDESCRTQRPWDTCAVNGRPRKLDYLLFSKSRLHPTPGTLPRLTRDTVLPSLTDPSDHLPLEVTFTAAE